MRHFIPVVKHEAFCVRFYFFTPVASKERGRFPVINTMRYYEYVVFKYITLWWLINAILLDFFTSENSHLPHTFVFRLLLWLLKLNTNLFLGVY